MKKFIALILALVMILSLTAVAFAGAKPDTIFPFHEDDAEYSSKVVSNGGLQYTENPYGSLARVLVNTITHMFGDKKDHTIEFHGIDKIGLADYHDDTVNAIANGIHTMINYVAHHVRNHDLAKNIYRLANKVGGAYAFFFSINGRGIDAPQ